MTRNEAAAWLAARDNFVLLTHRRPDGDTLGSAVLLCRGLRSLGKTCRIGENPDTTEKYRPLLENLTGPLPQPGETAVCVDVASENMLFDGVSVKSISLRIDHHGTAGDFTPYSIVEPETAACGELVYGILQEMGVSLDKPMADALYTAVSTDTGCFRYANTTASTLRVAADCLAAGADNGYFNRIYFETNSFGRLKIQSYITENAQFCREGKAVICPIPLKLEQELGVTEDELENISGFPRAIEGVRLAVTLRENRDGSVKASVRANPGVDAGALCQRFGGGGHKGAAGATLYMSLTQAAEAFRKAILEIEQL